MKRIGTATVIVAAALAAATSISAAAPAKTTAMGQKNIVQTAVAAGKFKTLVALVKKAGLAGTLSAPGNLESSLVSAGLTLDGSGEVVCRWLYADMDQAIRALLCSAGGARAAEAAGQQAVRDALRPALTQFQDPRTGAVTLRNTFRWVAARRRPQSR